jgi:hypothetical protein
MSYDLAVWKGPRPASDHEALVEYQRRYEESAEQPVPPSDEIAGFVGELLARFPEISEPVGEDSPWASAPLLGEASGDFICFPMTYSGAESAVPFCAEVAARRGLVCFDPQTERLLPREPPKRGLFRRRG